MVTADTVRTFWTRHAAQVIHDTVEWAGDGERAESDWLEAEKMGDTYIDPNWRQRVAETMNSQGLETFEDFQRLYGGSVWGCVQPNRRHLPRDKYSRCTFQ